MADQRGGTAGRGVEWKRRALVLESVPDSGYDDSGAGYEFPRRYLSLFEPLNQGREMSAIIYEPRGKGRQGRMRYVGIATLSKPPIPARERRGRWVVRYDKGVTRFKRPVARDINGRPAERWLAVYEQGRLRNCATRGRAVRRLARADFERIVRHGQPERISQTRRALPRATRFTARQIYRNTELSSKIGSKNEGGIRYSGRYPNIKRVAVVLTATPDAIYRDAVGRSAVDYVGEGQSGNQRLERGNRVLAWCHFNGQPVYVFRRQKKDQFECLGAHVVSRVAARVEPDRERRSRGVFVFTLEPVALRSG